MNSVSFRNALGVTFGTGSELIDLAERLSSDGLAMNWYEVAPGDGFPGGLHAHADQEEFVLILDGTVTVETLEGTDSIAAGNAIGFAPGEFHSLRNDGTKPIRAIGLGVPRETDDIRVPTACPACEHSERRIDEDDGATRFVCPSCGRGETAAPCPACGSDDLRFRMTPSDEVCVTCRACGQRYDDPPVSP